MKKLTILLICLVAVALFSFQQQPKTYTVNATLQDWQAVLEVIEHSNSPHQQVKAVQGLIIGQIEGKLKVEAKADSIAKVKADSLNKTKKP